MLTRLSFNIALFFSILGLTCENPEWKRFSYFRNFINECIVIQGLPKEPAWESDVFDVIKLPQEHGKALDASWADKLGPLFMPLYWDQSSYYCLGSAEWVKGVDSYVIYVENYCRTNEPALFLLNIKDNLLRSVLNLSRYEDGGFHFFSSYNGDRLIKYQSTVYVEEELSRFSLKANAGDVSIERETYIEVAAIKIDNYGHCYNVYHDNTAAARFRAGQNNCSLLSEDS